MYIQYPYVFLLNMLIGDVRGVFGSIFCDFGPEFTVVDSTGEEGVICMIETVTQDYPALITVLEESRHGLEVGNQVILSSIVGMSELNGVRAGVVQVKDGYSFTIDVDTRGMGVYKSGGYVTPVKQPINIRLVIKIVLYMYIYMYLLIIYMHYTHILYTHLYTEHT